MSATCPTCAAADETAAVRKAVLDADRPLDPPTRELLSMPPEPGRTSAAATVFFVLGGLLCIPGLRALFSDDSGGNSSAAYQFGYHYGGFSIAAVLLGIGYFLHSDHRSHRGEATGQWPHTSEQWHQLELVWREAWLCRRCRVAFLRDSPAPSAIPFAQFREWAAATAQNPSTPMGPTL
ncbi:hypothetical protein ACIBCA_03930 [Kitasatospora sp. NPDC051170]|uniref:hypothetical protein n=1 Tax=Kitasatospora sp. NPDC051170 TaxID=3364056 RepID=UPI0037B195BA